jgi:DNA-binding GntR family transcriptional regulator
MTLCQDHSQPILKGAKLGAKLISDKNKHVAEPIKTKAELNRIRTNLRKNRRDLLLFDVAVETGIGMQKILRLKVKDLVRMKEGDLFAIESVYGSKNPIVMTDRLYKSFHHYLEEMKPKNEDYLFKSKKGQLPLNLSTVSNMIKMWFKDAGIKDCLGAISLRKTWEYNHQSENHVPKNIPISKHFSIFKPIETPTAQQTVFNKLFDAIISGKIPPGTRITANEISKAFKVSPAPVRVALNWLEAKGFIISHKKSGSIVRELTVDELHEIIKIRKILELGAIELSYNRCTKETLNLLESIIVRYKNAYTFEESDQLNRLFHESLYRDSNMPLLTKMILDLFDRFRPYALITYKDSIHIPDQVQPGYYHTKILEGIRQQKLSNILKYMKIKISGAFVITEKILKQRQKINFSLQEDTLINIITD